MRVFPNRPLLLCMILLSLTAACRSRAENEPGTGIIAGEGEMEMNEGYSTDFADYRRSSFQNTTVDCGGEILWASDYRVGGAPPRALYLFGGKPLVVSLEGFDLYAGDGKFLWHQGMNASSPIGLTDRLIYFHDDRFRLSAVNAAHECAMENGYFPGPINLDYPLSLLWAGKLDYLYVVQFTGGAEELPPKVMVKRTVYGKRLAKWTYEFEGRQILPPLYLPEVEQVVVFADMIHFVGAADGNEISKREYPLEGAVTASADRGGTVYLCGGPEGKLSLAAFKAKGDPLWIWGDEEGLGAPPLQPPAVGEDGGIYILAGSYIVALGDGGKSWSFRVEDDRVSFCTAFSGGRLLAAAGRRLIGIDGEGKELFDIEFDDTIIAPPVGAGDGTVFLLTAGKLLRVR